MGVGAVICVDRVEQGTQYTALWSSGAEGQARGLVRTQSHFLGADCLGILNPHTQAVAEAQIKEFGDQPVGDDGLKSRAVVYEEESHICLLLVQVRAHV